MMKMTKREMFAELINLVSVADIDAELSATLIDKMNHEIELLEKKNASGSRGLTKTQKENLAIKDNLVAYLTDKAPMRVSEIVATDEFGMYSPSKISALLTQLKKEGRVIRTEVKKVPFYSV